MLLSRRRVVNLAGLTVPPVTVLFIGVVWLFRGQGRGGAYWAVSLGLLGMRMALCCLGRQVVLGRLGEAIEGDNLGRKCCRRKPPFL